MAEELRDTTNTWRVITNTSGGGYKSQFKKADKSGAELALIIGENELRNKQVSVKSLRKQEDQVTIPRQQLSKYLQDYLGEK